MKKSQITIFIVLGIVVMIIFGLVFFVSRQTSDVVLERKINRIYGDFLSSTGIKEYISGCLDTSVGNAMKIIALQGGKAYDYQVGGGYTLTSENEAIPFNYEGYVYNVSYGIKAPIAGLGGSPPVPQYPYLGPLVDDPYNLLSRYNDSVFALEEDDPYHPHSLTSLCNWYGSNYWDIPGAPSTCETTVLTNYSIQEYLKYFIFNRTKTCVNFLQFTENTKYNISEGKIEGFVLIGNDDLFISMNYPIIISVRGEPPITKFLDFKSRPKTRLKKVHELGMHLIGSIARRNIPKADANNIFFNITRDDPHDCIPDNESTLQRCILDGMNVSRIKDYCLNNPICDYLPEHYKYSDIINITDRNSIIDGEPLTFLFAIENRAPALNFTPDMGISVGDEIEFIALDPDEDNLTYNISNSAFGKTGNNKFTANSAGSYSVIVNVSDNEGLYDYQDVDIDVS